MQFLQFQPTNAQICALIHKNIFFNIKILHVSSFTVPLLQSTLTVKGKGKAIPLQALRVPGG
jgi:hypothetical protein